MKITREPYQFRPVTIVLETQVEFTTLKEIVTQAHTLNNYGLDAGRMNAVIGLYNALHNIKV